MQESPLPSSSLTRGLRMLSQHSGVASPSVACCSRESFSTSCFRKLGIGCSCLLAGMVSPTGGTVQDMLWGRMHNLHRPSSLDGQISSGPCVLRGLTLSRSPTRR